MHDSWAGWLADICQLWMVEKKCIRESAVWIPRSRVHDESSRLSDDNDVLVRPALNNRYVLRSRETNWLRLGKQLNNLALLESTALDHLLPINKNTLTLN
jgi:hypothetical protein